MPDRVTPPAGRVVAFFDIGTNSVRLLLVRVNPNETHTVLAQEREVVRFGETVFVDQTIRPAAMRRTLLALRHLASLALSRGAKEIIAVATSVTREARNTGEFVRRAAREAGVDVRTISGKEEARLDYLGVSSGLDLGPRRALIVDIGGGSTQVAVGDSRRHLFLDSLRLGAIRLTTLFLKDVEGPISRKAYAEIRRYVDDVAAPTIQRLRSQPIDLFVGTAGTIANLAKIATARLYAEPKRRNASLTRDELEAIIDLLRSLPLEERRAVAGMDAARADIIVPGAAVLDAFMDGLDFEEVQVSDRGIREGLLVDYLATSEHRSVYAELPVRRRSVLHLARACGSDEDHTRIVARLALELFDSASSAGIHRLGPHERELLEYAALLHDVGAFLSYENMNQHAWYLISSADMLGFDQTDEAIIAAIAFFARRGLPKRDHPKLVGLRAAVQRDVRVLCAFLRIADSLDRSRRGLVSHASLEKAGADAARVRVVGSGDLSLDVWGVENGRSSIEKMLGQRIIVEVRVQPRRSS